MAFSREIEHVRSQQCPVKAAKPDPAGVAPGGTPPPSPSPRGPWTPHAARAKGLWALSPRPVLWSPTDRPAAAANTKRLLQMHPQPLIGPRDAARWRRKRVGHREEEKGKKGLTLGPGPEHLVLHPRFYTRWCCNSSFSAVSLPVVAMHIERDLSPHALFATMQSIFLTEIVSIMMMVFTSVA